MSRLLDRLSDGWRCRRRALKARLPWVRRRLMVRLQKRWLALLEVTANPPPLATEARIHTLKAPGGPLRGEVCFFVTFAAGPALRPHVARHLEHLLQAGFEVALVLNTDLPPERLEVAPALLARLHAAWARENVGFDFGAWSHAWSRCGDLSACSRLLLVNDSIVGPLDGPAYEALLARLRASRADLVGLTANPQPLPHLQSYFLALGHRVLATPSIRDFFAQVRSMPTKDLVIDVYEVTLTRRLEAAGLTWEALFRDPLEDVHSPDATTFRWWALLEAGFPFIKGSVLRSQRDGARARALVPPALLDPAEGPRPPG